MKRLSLASLLAICGLILSTTTGSLLAQNDAPAAQAGAPGAPGAPGGRGGRGNWDPEQMRQRMMERIREQLAVKDAHPNGDQKMGRYVVKFMKAGSQ